MRATAELNAWRRRITFAAIVVAATLGCCEAETVQPRGLTREPVSVPLNYVTLDALVARPAGTGRFPLVIISHGSPRVAADAKSKSADWADQIANDFARRGYVVATVLRRGYGHSGGTVSEGYGSCKDPNYRAAGIATAQDILQAMRHFQNRPYVDPGRVVLVGVSAGGFGSIAAASLAPTGLVAVVNFAGGRGSPSPNVVCSPDDLINAYEAYGKTVRVPSLWIYAQNDQFFGPDLARRMFAAFRNSGAPAELIIAPPYGEDGHSTIFAQAMWRDAVYDFLKRNHLPFDGPRLPPPSHATAEVALAFGKYLATPNYEKAFVLGDRGAYGWASGRATIEEALAAARKACSNNCSRIYAIDDTLAEADVPAAGAPASKASPASPTTLTPAGAGAEMLQRLFKGSR